jgi:hypothetical protein
MRPEFLSTSSLKSDGCANDINIDLFVYIRFGKRRIHNQSNNRFCDNCVSCEVCVRMVSAPLIKQRKIHKRI